MPRNTFLLMGIDEAGCGPLAGPVVVAGVQVNSKVSKLKSLKFLRGIRDSKKLSPKQREEWFAKITGHPDVRWATAAVLPKTIDRINIRQAALLGARRVHRALAAVGPAHALLDGGLRLPEGISQETIIKGDEKIPLIAAASVIAKVRRDRIMRRLHKKYPQYRFDLHKGYGTKLHRAMIRAFGRCEAHRASFAVRIA